MEEELKVLEEKIAGFVQLCQHLRAENTQLRQMLANAQNENQQLAKKINGAKGRLESLLSKIPGEAE